MGGLDRLLELTDHFHSAAFSGLAGGAVEVYGRSEPWGEPGAPPRGLGLREPLAPSLSAAQFNAVVLVAGAALARAVRDDERWRDYVADLRALQGEGIASVFLICPTGFSLESSPLSDLVGDLQPMAREAWGDGGLLGREVAQAITQRVLRADGEQERIQVFVSHTKHPSVIEDADFNGEWIYTQVRHAIQDTHLAEFFDAHDIQVGADWETELDSNAAHSALLMVRTDTYASRTWTQREVFVAKRHDMPIVSMYALRGGEERGSFLMDHVPSVPCDLSDPNPGILTALNRLVDEALKRALWRAQTIYLKEHGFDWTPVHAPEPTTLAPWLARHKKEQPEDQHVWIIHPDPPLGERERDVVIEMCVLAGFDANVDVMTPRTFAARGGEIR